MKAIRVKNGRRMRKIMETVGSTGAKIILSFMAGKEMRRQERGCRIHDGFENRTTRGTGLL